MFPTGGSTVNKTMHFNNLPFLHALLGMANGKCEPLRDGETSINFIFSLQE